MNTNKNIYITPEEYEKMQSTFNCKTEYDNGRIICIQIHQLDIMI